MAGISNGLGPVEGRLEFVSIERLEELLAFSSFQKVIGIDSISGDGGGDLLVEAVVVLEELEDVERGGG